MPAGRVDEVAESVVADIGARQSEAERKGNTAEDDQFPTHVLLQIKVDHVLVAVNLAGVVENRGHRDVLVGDGSTPRMFDSAAGFEVFEITVRTRQVRVLC